VSGLTHCFYKYPARFSPTFVSTVIEELSTVGNVVLDPYMGGGTSVLEATVRGRRAIGSDINSLAVFVAKVKSTRLSDAEIFELQSWCQAVALLSYRDPLPVSTICPKRTHNLSLPRARPIKKLVAMALGELGHLSSDAARDFARCVLLNVSQWALNGRRHAASLEGFRDKVMETAESMLSGMREFATALEDVKVLHAPRLIHDSADTLATHLVKAEFADLVVTSPPYPGVHVLYHRWQVDGRRETPAPYWIANRLDGKGTAFYNFGDRRHSELESYFSASLRTLLAIRSVMKKGAVMVQMIAFSDPASQLRRYLENMEEAGFAEVRHASGRARRTWRDVPGRSWHANLQGKTSSAREVVLIHEAV
jgi:DNA modification methylase